MSDAGSVEQGGAGASEPGPGTVLAGKYRLSRRLGDGAMGVVFLGVHERLGREVAVKFLRPELSSLPDVVARFQREAELVTRIGHPSIVTVYDYGRAEDGSVYYVMEVLSGRPLRARLQEGPLTDSEVVEVFAPLLSAVQSAHAVGAVHRDLKPDNDAPPAQRREVRVYKRQRAALRTPARARRAYPRADAAAARSSVSPCGMVLRP